MEELLEQKPSGSPNKNKVKKKRCEQEFYMLEFLV